MATLESLPDPLNLDAEDPGLRPVSEIARKITGRRPSPATVWRWTRKGTSRQGVLPAVNIFGSQHTTKAAFLTWLQGTSDPPADDPPAERDEATRRRLIAA